MIFALLVNLIFTYFITIWNGIPLLVSLSVCNLFIPCCWFCMSILYSECLMIHLSVLVSSIGILRFFYVENHSLCKKGNFDFFLCWMYPLVFLFLAQLSWLNLVLLDLVTVSPVTAVSCFRHQRNQFQLFSSLPQCDVADGFQMVESKTGQNMIFTSFICSNSFSF